VRDEGAFPITTDPDVRSRVAGQCHVSGGDLVGADRNRRECVDPAAGVLPAHHGRDLGGQGLYHWAQVTGFIGGEEDAFENQPMAWQTATVYFAVIELVAAVGLWLATPWGAVVWLTTVVSMAVIELMFRESMVAA